MNDDETDERGRNRGPGQGRFGKETKRTAEVRGRWMTGHSPLCVSCFRLLGRSGTVLLLLRRNYGDTDGDWNWGNVARLGRGVQNVGYLTSTREILAKRERGRLH